MTNHPDRWDSPLPMPPSLPSMLFARSAISLTYINKDRGGYAMDKELLSSPNLHSLLHTILANDPSAQCSSKMNELKRCLLRARGLKVFCLQVDRNNRILNSDFAYSPLNLPFKYGDQFPTLEELTLDPCLQHYFPTKEHCNMWARCMDWSQLRKLDFNYGSPKHLLEALTGRVPQLKVFNFGSWGRTGAASSLWNCADDLNILTRFLDSIDTLESVKMHSWDDKETRLIRLALLARHGASLRLFNAGTNVQDAWEPEDFLELRERAPRLKTLVATLKLQKVAEGKGEGTIWPDVTPPSPKSNPAPVQIPVPSKSGPEKERKYSFARLTSLVSSSRRPPPNPMKVTPSPSPQPSSISPSPNVSVHAALTSFPYLTHLYLTARLSHDSYEFIMDSRDPFRWGPCLLKK